jgi:hypothetical protein
LKLDLILEFALAHQQVVDALPVLREIRKMGRSYVCNVVFTKIGDEFQEWVGQRCHERNAELAV